MRGYLSYEDGTEEKDKGSVAVSCVFLSDEIDPATGHYKVVDFDITSEAHKMLQRMSVMQDVTFRRQVNWADLKATKGLVELGQKLGVVTPDEAEKFTVEEGANVPLVGNA